MIFLDKSGESSPLLLFLPCPTVNKPRILCVDSPGSTLLFKLRGFATFSIAKVSVHSSLVGCHRFMMGPFQLYSRIDAHVNRSRKLVADSLYP